MHLFWRSAVVYTSFVDYRSKTYRDGLRTSLYTTNIPRASSIRQHSHGTAAGHRSAGEALIETVIYSQGLKPYKISMSRKDQRRGLDGDRHYYEDKDLASSPAKDAITPRHVLTMIDVDYFVDLPALLLEHDNSVMAYTVIPESVASNGITNHCFRDNEYHETVPGGSTYCHPLWDYSPDTLSVRGWKTFWTHTWKMYKVEKRQTSANRGVVLLQLSWSKDEGLVTYYLHTLAKTLIRGYQTVHRFISGRLGISVSESFRSVEPTHNDLRRLMPKQRDFNVLRILRNDGVWISIAREGATACVTIPAHMLDSIRSAQNLGKNNLLRATVESYLEPSPDRRFNSAILADYLANGTYAPHKLSTCAIVRTDNGVATFQYLNEHGYNENAPPSVIAFMPPLVGDSPSPAVCVANDQQCVTGRVNGVKHDKPLPLSRFLRQAINEFVMYLASGMELEPADYEVVWERQGRPSQRQILRDADLYGDLDDKPMRCFMKKESYGKITDPRNITQLPGKLKASYSRFIYALSDAIKDHPFWRWYAFGKTPIVLTAKVADVCVHAKESVSITDFSRMDGRKSNIGRGAWKMLLMQCFASSHHDELANLFDRQVDVRAVTALGVRFKTGWTQLSGSPDTSLSNSFETALAGYLHLRMQHVSADEAIATMQTHCCIGGDDGIFADVSQRGMTLAALPLGHVLTVETIKRGSLGVNFLSRYYSPNVWYGHPSSMCDVRRQLLKFHTTPVDGKNYDLPEVCVAKLVQKCQSFAMTDRHTPILGQLCERVLELADVQAEASRDQWWSQYDASEQFPQDQGVEAQWMVELTHLMIPGFRTCDFCDWVGQVKEIQEFVSRDRVTFPFMDEPLLFGAKSAVVMTGVSATLASQLGLGTSGPQRDRSDRKAKGARTKRPARRRAGAVPAQDTKKKRAAIKPTPDQSGKVRPPARIEEKKKGTRERKPRRAQAQHATKRPARGTLSHRL